MLKQDMDEESIHKQQPECFSGSSGFVYTHTASRSRNICVNIHKQGHAVLLSDMEKILDYCDVMLYGKNPDDVETDLQSLKQKEYFLQVK